MKSYKLNLSGEEIVVKAEKINSMLWFHYNGETYCVDQSSESRRSSRQSNSSGGGAGVIKAPMPGKIIKVFVKPGETVKPGQALVSMEAMKMEYNMESDIEGKVQEVNCAENEQVTMGKVLVSVKGESHAD